MRQRRESARPESRMTAHSLTVALFASLLLSSDVSSAWAVPLTVANAGFEDISGQSPFNEFTFGPPNDWDLYDPDTITSGGAGPTYFLGTLTPFEPDPNGNPGVYANFPDGAAEGQRVAIAFNFFGSGGEGEYGISQTLSDTLQPNTAYTLEVEIGNIASAFAMSGQFFDLDGFPGYRVDFLAGGVVIAQDNNSLFGLIDDGEFGTSTVTFTTGNTHPELNEDLTIRLVNLNQIDPMFTDSDLEVDFDDVRLDASPGLLGDISRDGAIDIGDFTLWADAFGETGIGLPADLTMDDEVDIGDFTNWADHFGETLGVAGGGVEIAAVPEPSAFVLAIVGGLVLLLRRSRRAHSNKLRRPT